MNYVFQHATRNRWELDTSLQQALDRMHPSEVVRHELRVSQLFVALEQQMDGWADRDTKFECEIGVTAASPNVTGFVDTFYKDLINSYFEQQGWMFRCVEIMQTHRMYCKKTLKVAVLIVLKPMGIEDI